MRTPLSESRLAKAGCMYLFHGLYLAKPKVLEPKTTPMLLGGFFHERADRLARAVAGSHRTADQQQAIMEREFDVAWSGRGDTEFRTLPEDEREDLRDLCIRWARRVTFPPSFQRSEVRVAVNERWEPVDWMAPDVFFRGIIDRLDLANYLLVVQDYKTSWMALPQREVERSTQLRSYAALGRALLPEIERVRVEFNYVRLDIVRGLLLERQDIQDAKDRIFRESDRIEALVAKRAFDPTPGALCEQCPLFDQCPAKKQAAMLRPPETPAQREALLGTYALQKRALDDTVAMLQRAVALHGPIEAGGLTAEYAREARSTYPVVALRKVLHDHLGTLDTDPYVKSDNEALKRLTKKEPALEPALAGIVQEKAYSRFLVHKTEEE